VDTKYEQTQTKNYVLDTKAIDTQSKNTCGYLQLSNSNTAAKKQTLN